MNLPNIVFLDIDGPVIPTPLYYLDRSCSIRRSRMDHSALGWIVFVLKAANAKLVTNSSHNYHDVDYLDDRSLKHDLMAHGIPKDYFHEEWRTKFGTHYGREGTIRMAAIEEWIIRNGCDNWVVFDDMQVTDNGKQVVIDFDKGICRDDAYKALDILGVVDIPPILF
jgi:hypothetical protein